MFSIVFLLDCACMCPGVVRWLGWVHHSYGDGSSPSHTVCLRMNVRGVRYVVLMYLACLHFGLESHSVIV